MEIYAWWMSRALIQVNAVATGWQQPRVLTVQRLMSAGFLSIGIE